MKRKVFTEREEKLLKAAGSAVTAQPGRLVYLKGDPADKIYYILKVCLFVYEPVFSMAHEFRSENDFRGQFFPSTM